MSLKTPPSKAYPKWTNSRFWGFVRAGLRRQFNKWPPKWEAKEDARRIVKGKRHKYEYKCAKCKKWFMGKEVEVDHIEPIGSLKTYRDLPGFVRRLFVPKNKLQILCKKCHKEKTQAERKR